ncbi:MAG TPA: bifunctional UDP-N-acetylglucosamine diphosphorylase/glucosamine-1-phosphate N-acetyltransferase GlmU [Thermotogota bacterium]|mgnify:CR=1 FL=1|nr:bifunctional UDP-N-acetylglucosamine diphosphorylase/glucosamine-1-phosphate N-acetyltransferase GlmU [Thermotogota bacterium]HRW91863.1 bifunctional UDP-N-acetylglucosamine diphosphorylase/glucosamine-1-phosphate N-acetyltransferase GlmU [Thermotogota bacterium]
MIGIILAAGMGKRMNSSLPKVLHGVAFKPMIDWVLDAFPGKKAVVVNPEMRELIVHLEKRGEPISLFLQDKPLGSGHALQQAASFFAQVPHDEVVVVGNGDVPLISSGTIQRLFQACETFGGALLTVEVDDPTGYGRIFRDELGRVRAIVEEKDCTPVQRYIREINVGFYAFKAGFLRKYLHRLQNQNTQGEYYLTDLVHILYTENAPLMPIPPCHAWESNGVNDRQQLATINQLAFRKINEGLMEAGVTILDPASTYIGPEVVVGQDTVIWPQTFVQGKTTIGKECSIGPMSQLSNCHIGDRVRVERSHLEEVQVAEDVQVGPFARLRKGTELQRGVKIGDFVEIKNSVVGEGSKAQHLSYLGDCVIEEDVNIGAGTITCNYDGFFKHPTWIGKGAFIGSNTSLVAPVRIGAGALVGAGSVIVRDVASDALALARGNQVEKKDYAKRIREKLAEQKKKREENAV